MNEPETVTTMEPEAAAQPTAEPTQTAPEPAAPAQTAEPAPAAEPASAAKPAPAAEPVPAAKPAPAAEPAPEPQEPDELTRTREQLTQALDMALNAEARAVAAGLGVRPERIQYAIKLADLAGIDLTQEGASSQIAGAIGKVLEALPELAGGAGTGSAGNYPRQSAKAADPFERGFDKG